MNESRKSIVTFGLDYIYENDQATESVYVLKIWDFTQLMMNNCK